jgi:hypothetical protein
MAVSSIHNLCLLRSTKQSINPELLLCDFGGSEIVDLFILSMPAVSYHIILGIFVQRWKFYLAQDNRVI